MQDLLEKSSIFSIGQRHRAPHIQKGSSLHWKPNAISHILSNLVLFEAKLNQSDITAVDTVRYTGDARGTA